MSHERWHTSRKLVGWIYAKTTVAENTQTWSKRGIRGVGGQMALVVTGKNIYKQTNKKTPKALLEGE